MHESTQQLNILSYLLNDTMFRFSQVTWGGLLHLTRINFNSIYDSSRDEENRRRLWTTHKRAYLHFFENIRNVIEDVEILPDGTIRLLRIRENDLGTNLLDERFELERWFQVARY